jgi:hypothetical protein
MFVRPSQQPPSPALSFLKVRSISIKNMGYGFPYSGLHLKRKLTLRDEGNPGEGRTRRAVAVGGIGPLVTKSCQKPFSEFKMRGSWKINTSSRGGETAPHLFLATTFIFRVPLPSAMIPPAIYFPPGIFGLGIRISPPFYPGGGCQRYNTDI